MDLSWYWSVRTTQHGRNGLFLSGWRGMGWCHGTLSGVPSSLHRPVSSGRKGGVKGRLGTPYPSPRSRRPFSDLGVPVPGRVEGMEVVTTSTNNQYLWGSHLECHSTTFQIPKCTIFSCSNGLPSHTNVLVIPQIKDLKGLLFLGDPTNNSCI